MIEFLSTHSRFQILVDHASRLQTIISEETLRSVSGLTQLCKNELFRQCQILEMNFKTAGSVFDLLISKGKQDKFHFE